MLPVYPMEWLSSGLLVIFASIRRKYQKQRKSLQKAKKLKTLKRLESKERRIITHINHIISKQLVQLAVDYGCGIRLEYLSNMRKTSKQRKKNKSDAAFNRDFWCYFQLENFILYKAQIAGIPVEKVPAPYKAQKLL
ncbi:MAG: IS200/IS605 family accessory protein TnpB-related protein [Xenococcaceae cyanobacterium MO_207.B15]|nr:IS200/IS605 family accessory protein TnpB-related protein [Xenococcaceae cyanobacterium MO_207.B15]